MGDLWLKFIYLSMTGRYSVHDGPFIVNSPVRGSLATPYAAGSVIRRSRVGIAQNIPVQQTIQTHQAHLLPHAGLTTSTILPGTGLRNSVVISPNQIPAGATIIRVDNPAEISYHGTPQTIHQTKRVTTEVPAPAVIARRGLARGVSSEGCPWWVWALLGLLGLLLLLGLLWGLLSHFAHKEARERNVETIVDNGRSKIESSTTTTKATEVKDNTLTSTTATTGTTSDDKTGVNKSTDDLEKVAVDTKR